MISAILKLLCAVLILTVVICWMRHLSKWDGVKHCQPGDCKCCPFPPCEDYSKNTTEKEDCNND